MFKPQDSLRCNWRIKSQRSSKSSYQDPNVSVVVKQIHSKVVYLIGEVVKRGPVEMTPGMTLLEAIASAGGLTDFANKKKIYVLRNRYRIAAENSSQLQGSLEG